MLIAAVPFYEEYLTQVSRKGTEIRLVRMETLAVVESGHCACYDWKMFRTTIQRKTGRSRSWIQI